MGSALFFLIVLVVLGCLCGPLPIVLGLIALGRIEHSGGQLRGRGLAIGAIVMGILALLAIPVLLVGGLFVARSAPMAPAMTVGPTRIVVSPPAIVATPAPVAVAPSKSSDFA